MSQHRKAKLRDILSSTLCQKKERVRAFCVSDRCEGSMAFELYCSNVYSIFTRVLMDHCSIDECYVIDICSIFIYVYISMFDPPTWKCSLVFLLQGESEETENEHGEAERRIMKEILLCRPKKTNIFQRLWSHRTLTVSVGCLVLRIHRVMVCGKMRV